MSYICTVEKQQHKHNLSSFINLRSRRPRRILHNRSKQGATHNHEEYTEVFAYHA